MPSIRLKEDQIISNISFIGFMGSGKTSISAELAKYTGYSLHCTDRLIELRVGKRIPEIFSLWGEDFFRLEETKVISDLILKKGIIDCGGGVVEREKNMDLLRDWGTVIWLNCPLDVIMERVMNSDRPLLQNKNYLELKEFYSHRVKLYEKYCHHILDSSKPMPLIMTDVLEILKWE